MAKGIGRIRTIGIAAQPTFGQAAPSATFVLLLTNAPQFSAQVMKVRNEAALGNAYQVNALENTVRFSDVPLEFKVDENHFPLILSQRFSIASGTVTDETAAYGHTLTFANSTQNWLTFFLQDDNLADYVVKDGLFEDMEVMMDKDFIRVTTGAVGAYPTETAVTNAVTQPKEFVGRMATIEEDAVPGTATATQVLSLTANLNFGINSEDTRFALGTQELAALELTSDVYMFNVSKLKSDTSYYDANEGTLSRQFTITVESTDRFVTPTSTRPSIYFNVPRAGIENYTEEPDLNELTKESFDLTALKPAGVSNTPLQVVVVNETATY